MKPQKFSLSQRFKSFNYAFNGIKVLVNEEHNSRIHFAVALDVILLGFMFHLNTYEWAAIVFSIGLVVISEIFNTAIENISDFICKERHESIKKIKDLSAAGVLVSAITAAIIGLIIFVPKVYL